MNPASDARFRWFGVFTLAWTVAWCADLIEAWRHAPYDRTGFAAALLWLSAVALLPRRGQPAQLWLIAAWLGSLLGVMGALHIAQHLAVVCAVCAWLPGHLPRLLAALAALAWMPAFGWLLASHSPSAVNMIRLVVASVALGAALFPRFRPVPVHP